MQIDNALILSAGLGTRMGEIGKFIPKVLWPVYFKTLLELQIRHCEDLGVKKIYVNTHFLHEEIVHFLKSQNLYERVTLLYEDPLLDSGGAIHNLASRGEVNYQGNLLLVNGDQFLFFNKNYWNQALNKINNCRAVLFGIKVDKDASYNQTILKNDQLVEIKKNSEKDHDYITYSGLGLLNLNGLKPVKGISRFFETVADYQTEKVDFVVPENFEYWDFGTAENYAQNIFQLNESVGRKNLMGHFLEKHSAFKGKDSLFIDKEKSAIDLECRGRFLPNTIQAKGLIQKI